MGYRVMEILEERRRVRRNVVEAASNWVRELPFEVTAILVGSYARGDFNLWSDVDVLLISKGFTGTPVQRLKAIDVPPGFQVIPLTLEEFERLWRKRDVLAVEAVESGITLKDDLKLIKMDKRISGGRAGSLQLNPRS